MKSLLLLPYHIAGSTIELVEKKDELDKKVLTIIKRKAWEFTSRSQLRITKNFMYIGLTSDNISWRDLKTRERGFRLDSMGNRETTLGF